MENSVLAVQKQANIRNVRNIPLAAESISSLPESLTFISKAGSTGGITASEAVPTIISSSWSHSFHELTMCCKSEGKKVGAGQTSAHEARLWAGDSTCSFSFLLLPVWRRFTANLSFSDKFLCSQIVNWLESCCGTAALFVLSIMSLI